MKSWVTGCREDGLPATDGLALNSRSRRPAPVARQLDPNFRTNSGGSRHGGFVPKSAMEMTKRRGDGIESAWIQICRSAPVLSVKLRAAYFAVLMRRAGDRLSQLRKVAWRRRQDRSYIFVA